MKRVLKYLVLIFSLAHAGSPLKAQHAGLADLSEPTKVLTSLIATLHHAEDKSFYGTAILYKLAIPPQHGHLFVTNAHVLPAKKHRSDLFLASPLWNHAKLRIRVVGEAPGYDLALIEIEQPDNHSELLDLVAKHLPSAFSDWRNLDQPGLAVIGHSGKPAYTGDVAPSWNHYAWIKESLGQRYRIGAFSHPVTLRERTTCPPAFLASCLEIPFVTWGFSGGVLAAQASSEQTSSIIGMISHFSPLTAQSFVIPWPQVQKVADFIWERRGSTTSIITEPLEEERRLPHSPHRLRIDKQGELYIASGPLAGSTVHHHLATSRTGSTNGGGSEHMIGGSEHMLGGPDGLPSASQRVKFHEDHMAYLGDYETLEKTLYQPSTWNDAPAELARLLSLSPALRGSQTFLSFLPKVVLTSNDHQMDVYSVSGTPTPNLGSFVQALANHPQPVLAQRFKPTNMPSKLNLSSHVMGLVNLASIRRFKHPATLRNQIDTLTVNDVGFSIPELADIITAAKEHSSDIIISKGKHSPVLAIKAAAVNLVNNHLEITMQGHRGGTARISLPAVKMIHTGPGTFRYAGKLISELPDIYWTTEGQRVSAVYGVVTLSQDPETKQYELKMLLAEKQTVSIAPERGFLTNEQLLLMGISLPLVRE